MGELNPSLRISLFPQKRNMQLCVLRFPKYSCYATKCAETARCLPDMHRYHSLALLALGEARLLEWVVCFVLLMSKMLDSLVYRWLFLKATHLMCTCKYTWHGVDTHTQTSALQFYEWVGCERLAEAAHWVKGSEPSFMTLGDVILPLTTLTRGVDLFFCWLHI